MGRASRPGATGADSVPQSACNGETLHSGAGQIWIKPASHFVELGALFRSTNLLTLRVTEHCAKVC